MSYRPLPNSLTIKPSDIDGLGLFAREFIKAGTLMGITHHLRGEIIRTPLGGFINHSRTPNCELIDVDQEYYRLQTLKDIVRGEELTISYKYFGSVPSP